MPVFKSKEEKQQLKAEELGFADKSERRIEDKGKPKDDTQCVEDGCRELKAPGQTYVCAKHCRSN